MEKDRFPLKYLLYFFIITLVISTTGYLFYLDRKNAIEEELYRYVVTIKEIKLKEIEKEQFQRRTVIRSFLRLPSLNKDLKNLFAKKSSDEVLKNISNWAEELKKDFGFLRLNIFNKNADLFFSTDTSQSLSKNFLQDELLVLLQNDSSKSSNLFIDNQKNLIQAIITPVRSANEITGYIWAEVSFFEYFHPILSYTEKDPGEIEIILLKENSDLGYILRVAKEDDEYKIVTLPLSIEVREEIKCLTEKDEFGEPDELSNEKIFASVNDIPGTDWVLIARINQDKAAASTQNAAIIIFLISLLLIILSASITYAVWKRSRLHFLTRTFNLRKEKDALSERYTSLTRYANDMILSIDQNGKILEANQRTFDTYGYDQDELFEMSLSDLSFDAEKSEEIITSLVDSKDGVLLETEFKRKNGTAIPVEISSRYIEQDTQKVFLLIIRDNTERKEAEKNLKRLNLLYNVLSQVNQSIVRIENRDELFKEICKIIVDHGKFTFAWIGEIIEKDYSLKPVSWCGNNDGYLDEINISLKSSEHIDGPAAKSFNEKKVFAFNDIETIEGFYYKAEAQKRNFRSLATVPITRNGKVDYILIIYSVEKDFFRYEEIKLLGEIGIDIAFALKMIDKNLERQQLTTSLIEREADLKAIFDSSLESFILFDKNKKINAFNKIAQQRKYHLLKKEMKIGDDYTEFLLSEDAAYFEEVYNRVLNGEIIFSEQRYVSPDGITKWFDVKYLPVYDSNNSISRILLNSSDVTERKLYEEKIVQLSRAVEQSPVSILVTDITGNITYVNPKLEEISGYTENELIGKNPKIFNSNTQSKDFYERMWKNLMEGKEWIGEFRNRKKNGELFWESASISPIKNENGEVTHFVAIKEDITARKKLESELIEAKENAEEMNRLKSNFLASISHELRTPMIGILGYSELLLAELTDSDQKEMVSLILKSGDRLNDTLNSILDLSKIESQKVDLKLEPTDIVNAIEESRILFVVAAKEKNLKLTYNPGKKKIYVNAEFSMINKIMNNLISNAIKYTAQGEIKILTEIKREKVEIKVSDTGIGILDEHKNIIFEPFRQVSEGFNRSHEGTGLGLTLTKRFVEYLGGNIAVESEFGKGSTFIVELPLSKPVDKTIKDLDSPSEKTLEPQTKNVHRPLILLVEDDELSIKVISKYLDDYFEVDSVLTADEALNTILKRNYDLVLMDIGLRGKMDGMEAAAEIRKFDNYKSKPIVAVTAYAMHGDKEKILRGSCSHYISKPFSKSELLKLLKSILEKNG